MPILESKALQDLFEKKRSTLLTVYPAQRWKSPCIETSYSLAAQSPFDQNSCNLRWTWITLYHFQYNHMDAELEQLPELRQHLAYVKLVNL